jgi:hypothetical protein
MKKGNIHTTNYIDTFIEVAEDTKVACGTKPPAKSGKKTIAEMQYELLANKPYQFTSDDVLFRVYADRNNLTEAERPAARAHFFAKGHACFRTSPLTKTYGFGVHANSEGKIAIYGMETELYEAFKNDPNLSQTKAMRNTKK